LNKSLSFRKCETYDSEKIKNAVIRLLDDLGGAESFFKRGEKILLKPNLLIADPKHKGIITHPFVTRAVAEIALESDCEVKIGDSPGLGSVKGVLEKSGFGEIFSDLPVTLVEFTKPVEIKNYEGRRFRKFVVDREVIEADAIINIAKVKSHGQMMMTLAVKNMFGCIVGKRKPQWHLKSGRSYIDFALMLVELHYLLKPRLNIVDGVWGMDGNGPSAGDPVKLGFLSACEDAVALDRAICKVLGVDPQKTYPLKAAENLGFGLKNSEVIYAGDKIESIDVQKFKLPRKYPLETLGVASYMAGFLKEALTDRPFVNGNKCVLCGECVDQCPSKVMSIKGKRDKELIAIKYRDCIRCYCCQEICPEHAISIKGGWLLRLMDKFRA